MKRSNKTRSEIIYDEMVELAKLVMKYSPSQLAVMLKAIDVNYLQDDMRIYGATKEEIRASSECYHDIQTVLNVSK